MVCGRQRESVFEVKWSFGCQYFIVADLVDLKLMVYENDQIRQTISKGIMDLDSDGRRWEGGIRDGRPFGFR